MSCEVLVSQAYHGQTNIHKLSPSIFVAGWVRVGPQSSLSSLHVWLWETFYFTILQISYMRVCQDVRVAVFIRQIEELSSDSTDPDREYLKISQNNVTFCLPNSIREKDCWRKLAFWITRVHLHLFECLIMHIVLFQINKLKGRRKKQSGQRRKK